MPVIGQVQLDLCNAFDQQWQLTRVKYLVSFCQPTVHKILLKSIRSRRVLRHSWCTTASSTHYSKSKPKRDDIHDEHVEKITGQALQIEVNVMIRRDRSGYNIDGNLIWSQSMC
jgi:hypothetical protein